MISTQPSLHTDLYQINMSYSYFQSGIHEQPAVFEVFFRTNPFNGGHNVFSGLEQIIDIITNWQFSPSDIDYLRTITNFEPEFYDYLQTLKFSGTIDAVQEGDIVFANSPLLIVQAPLIQAQLLETIILNIINFQTLIATKAAKFRSVTNLPLMEFGARRAHNPEAAFWGTRSCFIGGFDGTSLVSAGMQFDMPVVGTHAHSFVQVFNDEYTAFKKYAQTHTDCTFLVDTYDTLKSGVVNAIKVADEFGSKINFKAIRIDSGDLLTLTKQARILLDNAGYHNTQIIVSNDLDEKTILDLEANGAPINSYGVGTKVITAFDQPALGAVYKLVEMNGEAVIKISNDSFKTTIPSKKQLYRLTSNATNLPVCDVLAPFDYNFTSVITVYDKSGQSFNLTDFTVKPMLVPIFNNGQLVYELPTVKDIKKYYQAQLAAFNPEYTRFNAPTTYQVLIASHLHEQTNILIDKLKGDK